MCGICGYFNCGDSSVLGRMMKRMVHRGPDEEGSHVEPGVGLGVRRLSIIDPAGGHQPATNERKTVWVILNGEIYNYRELREELLRKGHRFCTRSDSEVLAHLYEDDGEAMVERLRGMFAICLWDSEKRAFFLIRDRLGIKPLYYAERNGGLVFASELGALREALPTLSVRPEAVAQYLTLLYVPAPGTIFEGVRQLMPGEILKAVNGETRVHSFFDITAFAEKKKPLAGGELRELFIDALKDSVRAHLVSDVPLGLFLSGGMDSGSILAMMRAVTDGPIRTFSIGYEDEADAEFNETAQARLMANMFGAEHTEELLRPNAAELLSAVVARMGEPFADSSAIPTYLVSQVASRSVKVALSGIGGDELFGGYPRYLGVRLGARLERIPVWLRKALARIAPLLPERGGQRDQVGRVKRFLRGFPLSYARQYIQWVTFVPPEWGSRAFGPALKDSVDHGSLLSGYENAFAKWPSRDPSDQAMGLDLQTYLVDDLLRMGDRLSMAHSLELRVPFCDHKLLEFALHVPAHVRFAGWQLKNFMRRSLESVLPAEITSGPKRGFMIPLARWLREDLREMVGDVLSEASVRSRGYVEPSYVRWLVSQHGTGRRNFSDQIFALLVLELWMRQEDSGAGGA